MAAVRRTDTIRVACTAVVLGLILGLVGVCAIAPGSEPAWADREYAWHADFDTPGGPTLVRGARVDQIRGDIAALLHALNQSAADPETFRTPVGAEPTDPPRLKFIAVARTVVRIEVINGEHLTQRMGSTGADAFLAVATFTLTEHEGVQSVDFVFAEGDHAQPGIYRREDFPGGKQVFVVPDGTSCQAIRLKRADVGAGLPAKQAPMRPFRGQARSCAGFSRIGEIATSA